MNLWNEMIIACDLESARVFGSSQELLVRLPPDSILVEYYWDGKDSIVSLTELLRVYENSELRETSYRSHSDVIIGKGGKK